VGILDHLDLGGISQVHRLRVEGQPANIQALHRPIQGWVDIGSVFRLLMLGNGFSPQNHRSQAHHLLQHLKALPLKTVRTNPKLHPTSRECSGKWSYSEIRDLCRKGPVILEHSLI
jgi:hypothetical protein